MAMKVSTLVLVTLLLITAMAVFPIAKAQLGFFLNLLRIQGIVYCSTNGSINGTTNSTALVFSNAVVQIRCANGSTVVSSGMTNSSGVFSIFLDPITTMIISTLLRDCKVVVTTPLSTCDTALPSAGALVSALNLLGSTFLGLLNISNLAPTGFVFTQNLNA